MFKDWEPWISILSIDQRKYRCESCYCDVQPPDPDIACMDCEVQIYCSYACRANDVQHRLECPYIAARGCLPQRDEVRVMLRAILKLKRDQPIGSSLVGGGGPGDDVPHTPIPRTFSHLLSHKEDFSRSKQRMEDIQVVYTEVEDFLGDELMPCMDEFLEVLGRLYINGFEICDTRMHTYGWGVYLGPSIMDHSCQPTACVTFSGCRLTVTCLRDVDDVDQLFISYCDTSLPAHIRREKLYSNYFFWCLCCKCRHSSWGHNNLDKRKRNKGKK